MAMEGVVDRPFKRFTFWLEPSPCCASKAFVDSLVTFGSCCAGIGC